MKRIGFVVLSVAIVALPGWASDAVYRGPHLVVDYDGPIVVDNSRFLYTSPDRLSFRTADYLTANHPQLLPLTAAIDSWASRLSVHPRLLTELVAASPVGRAPTGARWEADAVAEIAAAVTEVFFADPDDPLAASKAVVAATSALGLPLDLPADLATARALPAAQRQTAPTLFGVLQPPWEIGDTWAGGGAHGSTGSGTQNALDFWGEYRPWGQDVSQWWVAATDRGTVRVWSSCGMAIIHANGWVTDLYHLDAIQVTDMQPVERNTRLAHYANTEAQALCAGGSSTGPHVHMAITYNGQRVLVDQSQIDFTAFSHHVGVGQYDFNCATSWYDHSTSGKVCPSYDQLLNNASPPTELFLDDFESGGTSGWSTTVG